MESELERYEETIYQIMTENLGYIKVCAKFVPHTLKAHEKDLRIQHSRDIIKEARQNRKFLYSFVTGAETWCFEMAAARGAEAKRSQKSSQC